MSNDKTVDWPERYSAFDFLTDCLEQQRQMARAQAEWHARFMADQQRVEEWKLP